MSTQEVQPPAPQPATPQAEQHQQHPAGDPFAPRRGQRSTSVLLVVALVAGLAAGTFYGEEALHRLGLHGHEEGSGATASAQKQLWTCGMHPQVIQDKPGMCPICGMALEPMSNSGTGKPAASADLPKGAIFIDPVIVQNMGVRTARVKTGTLSRTIRATGYLQQPSDRLTDVNLRVSGWIEKLYVDTEGMQVKKGDKLFDIYSPDVQVAIEELRVARRSAQNLPQNADPVVRSTADSLLAAATRKLRQWGLDEAQIQQMASAETAPRTITFYSPGDGEVAEKMVVQGASVNAGERALRIVDRSRMWLDAQVFSMDLPQVSVGQKVTATVEGIAGGELEGQVSFIYPGIDPATRTATVRVVLENADFRLRPGMFATAHLPVQLAAEALIIPREAVLDTGVRQVVFVTAAEGHFAPKPVKLGAAGNDGMVQVLSGLDWRDTVVTSGQFLMDAESRMKEAVAKHLEKGLMESGARSKEKGEREATERRSESPETGFATKEKAAPAWTVAVDKAVAEYLKLAEALGAVQSSDTPVDPTALLAAGDALAKAAADDDQKSLAKYTQEAAKTLVGKSLDEQREAFKSLSDTTLELVTLTPAPQKLYLFHCPMAPGSWLQKTQQRANPYYATEMKECAVLKKEIAARK